MIKVVMSSWIICLVMLTGCQSQDETTYDMVLGEEAGDVIATKNEVKNLATFERFYERARYKKEDELVLVRETNSGFARYELVTKDGEIKLYSEVMESETGHKQYKLKIYPKIKKTLKQGVITYVLVNEQEEVNILSYKIN